jgi:hypothetical protein
MYGTGTGIQQQYCLTKLLTHLRRRGESGRIAEALPEVGHVPRVVLKGGREIHQRVFLHVFRDPLRQLNKDFF